METDVGALSATELAELAGATKAEVERMVGLGILVARDRAGPFRATDVQKVRLAAACEQAGLPMAGIASAIRAGRLSFAFLPESGWLACRHQARSTASRDAAGGPKPTARPQAATLAQEAA